MAINHASVTKAVYDSLKLRRDIEVWKNNTGTARIKGSYVAFGRKGSPDLIGLASNGVFVGIEIKLPPDDQNPDQIEFENIIDQMGGHYIALYHNHVAAANEWLDLLGLPRLWFK